MARLVTCGGELIVGSPQEAPAGFTGSVASTFSNVRTGTSAISCVDSTGSQASFITWTAAPAVAASTTLYARVYLRASTGLPASSSQVVALSGAVSARLTSAGKLQLWNESGTPAQIGSHSVA